VVSARSAQRRHLELLAVVLVETTKGWEPESRRATGCARRPRASGCRRFDRRRRVSQPIPPGTVAGRAARESARVRCHDGAQDCDLWPQISAIGNVPGPRRARRWASTYRVESVDARVTHRADVALLARHRLYRR